MQFYSPSDAEPAPEARAFYHQALLALNAAGVPFLVGGAYAYARYTGIVRYTKDFDVFIRPRDVGRALQVLADMGCDTELTFPHWLGKAFLGAYFIDLIFSAGNGVAEVDSVWLEMGIDDVLLDVPVKLIPVEEMIWSKGFIMERERFDGGDVAHLLLARATELDWGRLLSRYANEWRVLFSHLVLFGFVYPSERNRVPGWVIDELIGRLQRELETPPPDVKLCRGTLISREQYLIDIEQWGYQDARMYPTGNMTAADIEHWTAAINDDK